MAVQAPSRSTGAGDEADQVSGGYVRAQSALLLCPREKAFADLLELALVVAGFRLDVDPGSREGVSEVALVESVGEQAIKEGEQARSRILAPCKYPRLRDEVVEVAEQYRLEKSLLGGKVAVDRPHADAGLLGDSIYRGREPLAAKHVLSCFEDTLAVPERVRARATGFARRRNLGPWVLEPRRSASTHGAIAPEAALTNGTAVPYSVSGTTAPIIGSSDAAVHGRRRPQERSARDCSYLFPRRNPMSLASEVLGPLEPGSLAGGSPDPRRFHALAIIAVAQSMIVLDASVVTIALPSAQRALGISVANRQWVLTAYTLAFGGLLLLGGRIADYVGRKRMFIVSLLGFAGASALGGLAPTASLLFGARALQGAFAAIMAPAALSLLTVAFTEPHERARAFGVYGAIAGGGAAIGLILGGVLTEYASWRWTLLINVPIAITAACFAFSQVRESRSENRGRYDVLGAVTVTGGLLALVYGFTRAESAGWSSATTLGLLATAAVLLLGFAFVEMKATHPLLPLRVVLDHNRGGAFLASLLVGVALFGTFLFLTYYLQGTLGYSALRTGSAFLPFSAGIIIGASVASGLLPRLGARSVIGGGLFMAVVGLAWFTRIGVDTSYLTHVLPAELVVSLGMGLAFVPLNSIALIGVSPEDAGVASAMVNATQQVGGSLGTALLNTVAASATASYIYAHGRSAAVIALSLVHGYTTAFVVSALLLVAAVVAALSLVRAPRQRVATGREVLEAGTIET